MDGNGELMCNETEQNSSAAGCSDKESPDDANQSKDVSPENCNVDSEPPKESEDAQTKSNNPPQNNNKNKVIRGQKRRQKNNVHRVQGVAIPSLFPMPIVQDNFDLRNVLSGQGSGDIGPWWHRPPQHNFQPNNHQSNYQQTKKPRTESGWKKKTNNQNTLVERSEDPIEDILNPLKYVVVPVDYPNTLLSEQQSDLLQELLIENILKIQDDNSTPRFWRSFMRQGALLLYLADEKSIEWLVDTVPSLTLNDNIKCKTGPAKDIILTRKFNTLIPKLLKDLDEVKILKLLKNQNPGLKCQLWQVVSSQSDEKGQNMTLAVDEESYKIIRVNSFKAHLGLGIIKFNNAQQYNIMQASNN